VSVYFNRYRAGDAGVFPSNLGFDRAQAAQCINLQRTRGCTSEDGAEKGGLYATCMTAVQGILAQGVACRTSLECRAGLYCSAPSDAGGGSCTPLATSGQACDDPNFDSDRCTYLGIQSATLLHCTPLGSASGTCVAGLPIAAACSIDQECASGVCSSLNRTCVNSQPYPSPGTCTTYTKAIDAGSQGG
jgi:hypothetical protein